MPISAFGDKGREPGQAEIAAALGEALPRWHRLAAFMTATYGVEGALKHYGKSYGWMLWFRRSGKTLLALYPQQDALVAQVVLGPSLIEPALALPLPSPVRLAIEQAHPYPEGRWLFLRVTTDDEAAAVEQLVLLKQRPPRRSASS
jgi:hypothetical protein